jgi:hypothetical protein
MRPNSKLIKSTLTGALGGLLFGFDTVVISGIIESVVRLYSLSDYDKGLTVAVAGTAACLAGVAWVFISQSHQAALLGLLVVYIAFFALSQGAVIWIYIGEVFPTSVRSKGQGAGNASHWITNTIIAFAFPVLAHKYGSGTPFVFFACATLLQLFVVTLFYPETKGQTLEQLQGRLVKA